MTIFTPQLKHHILTQYQPHSRDNSFAVLARRYAVAGGESTVRKWYQRWDGTSESLERRMVPGRPRLLTNRQVNNLIRTPIRNKNRSHTAVHYTQVLQSVREKSGTDISLRTLQNYGKRDVEGRGVHTIKTTEEQLTSSHCDSIATIRRKLQRLAKDRVLFLDETAVRLSEAPTTTIVLPGETKYVVVEEDSSYAKRFDMIACINGEQVFAPCIYTPKERSNAGVKGINTEMLVDYILSTLGQETWALDRAPLTLVVDRSSVHSIERMMEAFQERGGHVMDIILMPTKAAKRLSPLDNALFHDFKQAIRKHGPLTLRNMEQVMSDEWNRITSEQIKSHYHHCGLVGYTDVYRDCPLPQQHRHHN